MKNNLTTIQEHLNNWYILTYANDELFNKNILNSENSIKYEMWDILSFNQNEATYLSQILALNPELSNYQNYNIVLIEPEKYISLVYKNNSNINIYTFLKEMYNWDLDELSYIEALNYSNPNTSIYNIIENIKNSIMIETPDIIDLSNTILTINNKNNNVLNSTLLLEKNKIIQNSILIEKILSGYISNLKKSNETYLLMILMNYFIKNELVEFYTKKYNSEVYIINKVIYKIFLDIDELFKLFSKQNVNLKWELEKQTFDKNIDNYTYLNYFLNTIDYYYSVDELLECFKWEDFKYYLKWISIIIDIMDTLNSKKWWYLNHLKLIEFVLNNKSI